MEQDNFNYWKYMMEYWKPRTEKLYETLCGRKGGVHDDPYGHKKQKRAKENQEFRKTIKEQLSQFPD